MGPSNLEVRRSPLAITGSLLKKEKVPSPMRQRPSILHDSFQQMILEDMRKGINNRSDLFSSPGLCDRASNNSNSATELKDSKPKTSSSQTYTESEEPSEDAEIADEEEK